MMTQAHIPAPQTTPAGLVVAGLHLSEIPYLCDMTRSAHMPLWPLRGQTYFERLMKTMPHFEASFEDLFAYFYVFEVAERLGVELDTSAPTLRRALGGVEAVDSADLLAATDGAWAAVRDYLAAVGRGAEWRECDEDDFERAGALVARLWDEEPAQPQGVV